jgi:3-hydroxy-9,10-secoandrosta-1,3,5(10)-triene-9,17-dione monooxygenase reductase component
MIDPGSFRAVLSEFCTGVTVVTACDAGTPVGFACQSFAALSLDPPLVLFCPGAGSRSWPAIQRAGRFAVNVLSADQVGVSAVFGGRGVDKFAEVEWVFSPGGAPVLSGCMAWIDCTVEDVHPGGDHVIVVGRVVSLEAPGTGKAPLLFHRAHYTSTSDAPAAEPWLAWSRPDDWI